MKMVFNLFTCNLKVNPLYKILLFSLVLLQSNFSFGQELGAYYGVFNHTTNYLVVQPVLSNNQTVNSLNIYIAQWQDLYGHSNNSHITSYTLAISTDNGTTYTDVLNASSGTNQPVIGAQNVNNIAFGPFTYMGAIITGANVPDGVSNGQYHHFNFSDYNLDFHTNPFNIKFRLNSHVQRGSYHHDYTNTAPINFTPNYGEPIWPQMPIPATITDNSITLHVSDINHTELSANSIRRVINYYYATSDQESSTLGTDYVDDEATLTMDPIVYDNLGPNFNFHHSQLNIKESNYDNAKLTVYQIQNTATLDVPLVQSFSVNNRASNTCDLAKISFSPLTTNNYIDEFEYLLYDEDQLLSTTSTSSTIDVDLSSYAIGELRNLHLKTKAKYSMGTNDSEWKESVAALTIPVQRIANPSLVTSFTVVYNELEGQVDLNWNSLLGDNTVDDFDIYRDNVLINTGTLNNDSTISFGNSQSFSDASTITNCSSYDYMVNTKSCGNTTSSEVVSVAIIQGLSNTFTTGALAKNLSTSKGYFADKVNLSWENNNNSLVETFIINRRLSSTTTLPWETLAQLNNSIHYFEDEYTESGKFYEYQIEAKIPCGLGGNIESIYSDISQGYRVPEASVSGGINFEGANAVENVKVLVNSTATTTSNKSLVFNGNNSVDISSAASGFSSEITNSFTFSTWMKPNYQDYGLAYEFIFSIDDVFNFRRKHDRYGLVIRSSDTSQGTSSFIWDATTGLASWTQITLSYNQGTATAKLYANGIEVATITNANVKPPISSSSLIKVGSHSTESVAGWRKGFYGNLDEIRLWNRALTAEEVTNSYDRYIDKNDEGLIAMYHCDEGIGSAIYDQSKSEYGYNKNDGEFVGAVSYSNNCPSVDQIANYALTDENGNYIIEGIRYNESGGNYTISPITGLPYYSTPHQFEPSQRVVYLGDGSATSDGQNFTDISSFTATGFVYYNDLSTTDTTASSCPVKDAQVYIDGNPVIFNDEIVKTNSLGQFSVEVPIGNHKISVHKQGHEFYNQGKLWYDFVDDRTGIQFVDITTRTVRGRAVGGLVEADKMIGFGLSKNNIGQAAINFSSQLGGGCSAISVETDVESGEYKVVLLPEKYIITFGAGNNTFPIASNAIIDFGTQELLDLTDGALVADTIKSPSDSTISVLLHKQVDFIHRVAPEIIVKNTYGNSFIGDESIKIGTTDFNLREYYDANNSFAFGSPIMSIAKQYDLKINVVETYVNKDVSEALVYDEVPVVDPEAEINIVNSLAQESTIVLPLTSIELDYSFKAGLPEINSPYTKELSMVVSSNGYNMLWDAYPSDDEKNQFEAVINGSKAIAGSDFFSAGPQVVDFILRDPPGDGSYSYFESGITFEKETIVESNSKNESNTNGGFFSAGPSFEVGSAFGLGAQVTFSNEVNIIADGGFDITRQKTVTSDKTLKTTTTFNQTYETNTGLGLISHHGGDLYVGESKNMIFSKTNLITILAEEDWLSDNTIGSSINIGGVDYKLGKVDNVQINPANDGTFIYTQEHIQYILLRDLKMVRNNLLQTDSRYQVVFNNNTNKKYASNNDNELYWDVADTLAYINKYHGESYIFTPLDQCLESNTACKVDSVRWFNQQIGLWEAEIAKNEQEKIEAFENTNASEISTIALSAGVTYTEEKSSSNSSISTKTIEYNSVDAGNWAVGVFFAGVGGQYQGSHSVDITEIKYDPNNDVNNSGSTNDENSTTFGFSLSDSDGGDAYLINVYPGSGSNGPIFQIDGGQTSCPYYPPTTTQYYTTGALPMLTYPTLDNGTIQIEVPTIKVNGSDISAELFNVPEAESAVFTLSLGNESYSGDDQYYTLKILESSNPNGAILKVDGLNPNRDYLVPAGTAIAKTLTLQRGPASLDYENIKLVFHSGCQYNPTDNTDNIADTVLVSAHFLPTCTDINFIQPDPNWVVNTDYIDSENKTSMNAVMSGYNLNYYSLDKINFQYKSTNASTWNILTTYHETPEVGTDEIAIPHNNPYILYEWDMSDLVDGDYDIRALTNCGQVNGSPVEIYTDILSGHIDRVRPHSFGTPSPADGILDPNDEIQLNFNESIIETDLGDVNFSLSGILNGSELDHDASLQFVADAINPRKMYIPSGIDLRGKSYTLEMWVKRETGASLFTQGYNQHKSHLQIHADGRLRFVTDNNQIFSTATIPNNVWTHVAVRYDYESRSVDFIINGSISANDIEVIPSQRHDSFYTQEYGPITIGDYGQLSIHGLRIWKGLRLTGDIYANMLISQTGNEPNLMGCWPMDELEGEPRDKARAHHATTTANWHLSTSGRAYGFNGSQFIKASSPAFRKEQDFTIELWFKTNGASQTILSNGSEGSTFNENPLAWSIATNTNGNVQVTNNLEILSSLETYTDNNWHYLALVKKNLSNTTLYIDGVEQASKSSTLFNGFNGSNLVLGAKPFANGPTSTSYSNYLNGGIDELRIWNKARTLSQINRDTRVKLMGDENGLVAYYPFETYALNESFIYQTYNSLNDEHTDTNLYDANNMVGTGTFLNSDIPLIRRARSLETVNYLYSSNNDKVIFTITDELKRVEGCILDIEVSDVKDLYGNKMASPISWTAYVNKNQLIWDEQIIEKEKTLGEPLTFETHIVNQGGTVENFEISNLPVWLTANPSEGLLSPNSFKLIEFVVNETLFIGDYSEDIMLTGNNDYAERMELSIDVEALAPVYSLNPSDYLYTMNFVGKVSVENIRSRDEKDVLFAYVGDELRGATELVYIEDYDAYFVFLSVYSNSALNETVEFRLWDASEGKIQTQVLHNLTATVSFEDGAVVGSFSVPSDFIASNNLLQEIPLTVGWNWVSFNLNADDGAAENHLKIPTVMTNLTEANISNFKSQTEFAQYVDVAGMDQNWFGSLTELSVEDMFMIQILEKDTIVYEGEAVATNETPIAISSGWNWIGYLGQRMLGLNEALSSLSPTTGDVIKSKTAFSMYGSEAMGWLGSLNNMQPGLGYMLRTTDAGTLTYPENAMFGSSTFRMDYNNYATDYWTVEAGKYENSMSIIALIEHPDYLQPSLDNVLGAFSSLNCVGNISATPIHAEESLYFITVYGVDDNQIRFDYYDAEKDKVYRADNVITFESNTLVGTLENPYPITIDVETQNLEDLFDFNVYPNPFADLFDLSFTIEESSKVEIQVFDVLGGLVQTIPIEEFEKGTHKLQLNGENFTKGVYFIELIMGEDSYKKMIVKL